MQFKLGSHIKVGHKIKTTSGWRKVLKVTDFGVIVKEGEIKFGSIVFGWKSA